MEKRNCIVFPESLICKNIIINTWKYKLEERNNGITMHNLKLSRANSKKMRNKYYRISPEKSLFWSSASMLEIPIRLYPDLQALKLFESLLEMIEDLLTSKLLSYNTGFLDPHLAQSCCLLSNPITINIGITIYVFPHRTQSTVSGPNTGRMKSKCVQI